MHIHFLTYDFDPTTLGSEGGVTTTEPPVVIICAMNIKLRCT